jgi:hypothetical protein
MGGLRGLFVAPVELRREFQTAFVDNNNNNNNNK